MHLLCINIVFIPVINTHLSTFRHAWNKHKIRTEGHKSPEMLWLNGVLSNLNSASLAMTNIFDANPVDMALRDALQHFNLHIEQFTHTDCGNNSQLHDEQIREITHCVNQISDLKEKFSKGLQLLQRMHIS